MEGWDGVVRESRVDLGRGLVRWNPLTRSGDRLVTLRPTLGIVGPERRVLVLRPDLPDPAFLHERIFGDLATDFGALAECAGKRELANSRVCALAVVGYMDHVLVQEVLGDFPLTQAGRSVDVEAATDVFATDVDAALRRLSSRAGSEEFRSIVPLPFVPVETVCVLQVLDGVGILESRELLVERCRF